MIGGLGSAVCDCLSAKCPTLVKKLGMQDVFGESGPANALLEKYGLDAQTVEAICELRNPYYTVAVENILAGRGYDDLSSYGGSAGTAQEEEVVPENTSEEESEDVMEDLLPEEQELLEQLEQE